MINGKIYVCLKRRNMDAAVYFPLVNLFSILEFTKYTSIVFHAWNYSKSKNCYYPYCTDGETEAQSEEVKSNLLNVTWKLPTWSKNQLFQLIQASWCADCVSGPGLARGACCFSFLPLGPLSMLQDLFSTWAALGLIQKKGVHWAPLPPAPVRRLLHPGCFILGVAPAAGGQRPNTFSPHLNGGFTSAFILLFTLEALSAEWPGTNNSKKTLLQKDCLGGFSSLISLLGKCWNVVMKLGCRIYLKAV